MSYIAPDDTDIKPLRFYWHLPAAAFSQEVARSGAPFPCRATMPYRFDWEYAKMLPLASEEAQRMVTTGAPTSVRRPVSVGGRAVR
jgi:hypothetical protein